MPAIATDLSGEALAVALTAFLAEHPAAAVLEDGRVLFEMSRARFAVNAEHGRCVLQLWSEERNIVRTVTGLDVRKGALRLEVRRFGQTRPQLLHLLADRDQRTPSTRSAARARYVKQLLHVLPRHFGDWQIDSLRAAMDLEHSFGPAYARGVMTRGQSAWALIGVDAEETQPTIDGILTLGILWLAYCRERAESAKAARGRHVEGLRIVVPAGCAALTQTRMGWLNAAMAKWELYALDPRTEELQPVETGRNGNLEMRMIQYHDAAATRERLQAGISKVMALVPEAARGRVEQRAHSASEVGLVLHGLEFARVRHALQTGSFTRQDRISFGAGAQETELTAENEAVLASLTAQLFASRHAAGDKRDPLYRLQPERWLESGVRDALPEVEPALRAAPVYQQVPAFEAGDRGMLDLLAVRKDGRLAVLELKAEEDLHMPLQGLDYWIRVQRAVHSHAADGGNEFTRHGYFPGVPLADAQPLLYFIAPALRVHPATETVLKALSPEIEWQVIAVGEHWRQSLQVIWRKHSAGAQGRTGGPVYGDNQARL